MGWNYWSIPDSMAATLKLGMVNKFDPILDNRWDYLSMLGLKLINTYKRDRTHVSTQRRCTVCAMVIFHLQYVCIIYVMGFKRISIKNLKKMKISWIYYVSLVRMPNAKNNHQWEPIQNQCPYIQIIWFGHCADYAKYTGQNKLALSTYKNQCGEII